MKTKNHSKYMLNYAICLLIALSFNIKSFGQVPNAIPYQGVARDASGAIMPLQSINLEYIIHDGTAAGIVVFSETHNVTTTSLGLFNLNIGEGTPGTGALATIDWGHGAKFIEVVLDGTSMGTTQLNSVPYALYARSSGGDFVDLTTDQTIAGTKTFNEEAIINGVRVGKGGGSLVNNTAMGKAALIVNTTGDYNAAYGPDALTANTVGNYNSAYGMWSLSENVNGSDNSAYGVQSLKFNIDGSTNSAFGVGALYTNISGNQNTAIGYGAGQAFTGDSNTALGAGSGTPYNLNLTNTTTVGAFTQATSSNSLILVYNANVGIGTSAPVAKLDVIGNVKITDGTEGAGKVLTSDATGVASWQDANSGGVTSAEINVLIDRIDALEARVAALEPEPFSGSVGDIYQGGIVFWIDPQDNTHGLVCAETDGSSSFNWNEATAYCANYSVSIGDATYDDWFLPTIEQLNLMYTNLHLQGLGNFISAQGVSGYWSSSDEVYNGLYVSILSFDFGSIFDLSLIHI